MKQTVKPDNRPDLLIPSRPDEHVFIAVAAFRMSPDVLAAAAEGETTPHLDRENLASINVGCYRCERGYTRELAARPCTGDA